MIEAGSWLCLLAPLAGCAADHACRHPHLAHGGGVDLDRLGVRRLRGRGRRVRAGARGERRRPRASLHRVHLARDRRLPGADADPRRPDLADDDADHHRRRRADRLVLGRLHARRGRGAPLLRLYGLLRLRDADARDGRQPLAAARRLGSRRPCLLPPDRLLPRPSRGDRRREEGIHHERDRRRRIRARPLPAALEDGHAGVPHGGLGGIALLEHREPGGARPARRRDREVGAAPAAHLVAGRDGGPDAGLGTDPCRDDGHGRRLPDRAHRSRCSKRRRRCSISPRSSAQ